MRDIEQPYDDAYVEFFARYDGDGAVPYLPESNSDWWEFAWLWFKNKNLPAYIHAIGAGSHPLDWGLTLSYLGTPYNIPYRTSYVFEGKIEADIQPSSGFCIKGLPALAVAEAVLDHEFGHQFNVNPNGTGGHCSSQAWTANGNCMMNTDRCPVIDPNRFDDDSSSTASPNGVYSPSVSVTSSPPRFS